jgi:hypothetical protein
MEAVMTFRNKTNLIVLAVIVQLLFFGNVRAGQLQPGGNDTGQEIVTGPEQHDTKLVSLEPWVIEGEVLGAVAMYVYADATTKRAADYWEFYDNEGDLLAVSWFDKFGIHRTAVDRGILEEEDKLEGVFVVVAEGNQI